VRADRVPTPVRVTIVVGIVCGLVAVAFHLAIKAAEAFFIDRALHATGHSWIAWTLLSRTLGGLAAGLVLKAGARGSGIPQVKKALALEGGRVPFRDAVGKFFVGALQIGSGASLGREGPTVQICRPSPAGIEEESFSAGKLRVLEDAMSARGVCVDHAARLMKSFDFEADKIAALKLMAPRLTDRQNKFKIYKAFDFDASRDEAKKILK